jgi:hypothetical protein
MSSADQCNVGLAATALLASSATLLCCVLPAILVSLGAGATLLGLITAFPQLIWLSDHKPGVFGIAAAMLAIAGASLWHARRIPCPIEPEAARQCARLRIFSRRFYALAASAFLLGTAFAFGLPRFLTD